MALRMSDRENRAVADAPDAAAGALDAPQQPPAGDLQAAFARFRRRKMQAIRNERFLQQAKAKPANDAERKQRLREKFVETARSYFGVPYAKKYHEPGTPLYESPLFLDCCGLVRQCVNDLKEDFGFSIGPWNQAYQFDTLPIRVGDHSDLKPGDLVFYSATYYSKLARPQRHDMVHVEIFIGGETGEQTIGARWQKGVVQVFDSYKFESKLYHSIKWHYCSIDTWLDGVCESVCDQHPWRRVAWQPGTKSIFAPTADDDDMFMDASDEQAIDGSEANANAEAPLAHYYCKGNGAALVRHYFDGKLGWTEMPETFRFSSKYAFRWTELLRDVDFHSFRAGEQLVNHVPNTVPCFTKLGLLNLLRKYRAPGDEADASGLMPETYRLDVTSEAYLFFTKIADSSPAWIIKPLASNMGRGIEILSDLKKLRAQYWGDSSPAEAGASAPSTLPDDATAAASTTTATAAAANAAPLLAHSQRNNLLQLVAQRYLLNPVLVRDRKCDIRCYCLIACTDPLVVMFRPGYVRVCSEPYKAEAPFSKFAHLTNLAVQRKSKAFDRSANGNAITMETFASSLREQYGTEAFPDEFVLGELNAMMQKICTTVMHAVRGELGAKRGFFELIAFDFLLDEAKRLWLLEVNTNPALFTDCEILEKILPQVSADVIDIELALLEQYKAGGDIDVAALPKTGFTPLDL